MEIQEMFDKLAAPFPPEEIEWRSQSFSETSNKALALAYITARAVMDRLDEVAGPAYWHDEYKPAPDGGVLCGISIFVNNTWLTKWDGAPGTDIEAVKGGISDSFKRAAVKWGIGRYLYRLDSPWVRAEKKGKFVKLLEIPQLPKWALPTGANGNGKVQNVPEGETTETKNPSAEAKKENLNGKPFAARLAMHGRDKNGFLKMVKEEFLMTTEDANVAIKRALHADVFEIKNAEKIYDAIRDGLMEGAAV